MTNYNDGNWHGWNGGECPVHPKSVVDARWKHTSIDRPLMNAGDFDRHTWLWGQPGIAEIVAFRVVKEYSEPRECWAYLTHMHDSLADAEAFRAQVDAANPGRGYLDTPITHWREVVD